MGNTDIRSEELRVQGLLDLFLADRFAGSDAATDDHLDDDTASAFVEGTLNERESAPIMRHLVDCSFCLHMTSELIRLDLAFADEPVAAPVADAQPSKVSEVLGGLLSRIFGAGEVFAHQEPEDDEKDKADEPGK